MPSDVQNEISRPGGVSPRPSHDPFSHQLERAGIARMLRAQRAGYTVRLLEKFRPTVSFPEGYDEWGAFSPAGQKIDEAFSEPDAWQRAIEHMDAQVTG